MIVMRVVICPLDRGVALLALVLCMLLPRHLISRQAWYSLCEVEAPLSLQTVKSSVLSFLQVLQVASDFTFLRQLALNRRALLLKALMVG